jgi:hypothetical protein
MPEANKTTARTVADADVLKAAPKATVVEPTAPLRSMPLWELYHYEHGKPAGGSFARGDQVREWLDDLERAGYLIGLGWELRGDPAPDDWPGWPADNARAVGEAGEPR